MRAINRLPVDDDILDRIFTFIPTFGTLKSLILVSKAFYTVFSAHPSSILRAVAYNIAGLALPQLIAVLRRKETGSSSEEVDDDEIFPLSREEMAAIEDMAQVARALEDAFSVRHKDRQSKSSALTPAESHRFVRAIYRIWLYTSRWPGNRYTEEDSDADYDEDKHAMQKFLDKFKTQELLEIHAVSRFLAQHVAHIALMRPSPDAPPLREDDFFVSAEPALIHECYQLRSLEPLDEFFNVMDMEDLDPALLSDYISGPISRVLAKRNASLPAPDDPSPQSVILETVSGEKDACTQCGAEGGLNLWGQTNWPQMAGTEQFSSTTSLKGLATLLKSNLKEDSNITLLILDRSDELKDEFYPKLMKDIFSFKMPDFANWTDEDWLCEACLSKLVSAHLHLVLLQWKRDDGQTVGEDCPYGWDCPTQIDNLSHALEVNHLCEPTKTLDEELQQ